MRLSKWLNSLRRNERGNVLLVGAASLPLLIGAVGLSVDAIQLALWKRQLQRAADSSAIAGAYALAQGAAQGEAVTNDLDEHIDLDLDNNETPVLTDVTVNSGSYGEGTISTDSCAARGVSPCFGRAVEVRLTSQRTLPFMSMFTRSTSTIRAEGVAALVDDGEYCMISLYDGTEAGINANGNAAVGLGCGIATNSRADSAVLSGGSSSITASPVAAVGGIDGDSQNFDGPTTLQPYSTPIADPFASVPDPSPPCSASGTLAVGNGQTYEAEDTQCFKDWDIKGTLILPSGTHYVNNGTLDLKGRIECTACTIILTGDDSDFVQNGGGDLVMTPPESGDYAGIVLYRDRRADYKLVKITGGADTDITGAIYMPTTDLWLGGNSEMSSSCLQVVGRIITFRGGASISNSCPAGGAAQPFDLQIVRLVG